jgi:hypothetical protein
MPPRRLATRAAIAAVLAAFVAAPAVAVESVVVTVRGDAYRLTAYPDSRFADNRAAFEASPWWGDALLAIEFGEASAAAGLLDGGDYILPYGAFGENGLDYAMRVGGFWGNYACVDCLDDLATLVAGAPAPAEIPEIDGAVLARLALVLGVGWLLAAARRADAAPTA